MSTEKKSTAYLNQQLFNVLMMRMQVEGSTEYLKSELIKNEVCNIHLGIYKKRSKSSFSRFFFCSYDTKETGEKIIKISEDKLIKKYPKHKFSFTIKCYDKDTDLPIKVYSVDNIDSQSNLILKTVEDEINKVK